MISTNAMQSYYLQAEQFRKDRFLSEFKSALSHHFLAKAPHRIPEFAVILIKKTFPKLANYLAHLGSQTVKVKVISPQDSDWLEVANLTETLRKKAGITIPIYPCYSTSHEHKLAAFENVIVLNRYVLSCSQEEKEFLIMHELMHIHLSHLDIRLSLCFFFAAVDLIFLYYYSIKVTVCFEFIAFYIESSVSCYQEKEADLRAIEVLETNQGAIETCQKRMDKTCPIHNLQKLSCHQQEELRKIQKIACNFSEISHPSTTERLLYCEAAK